MSGKQIGVDALAAVMVCYSGQFHVYIKGESGLMKHLSSFDTQSDASEFAIEELRRQLEKGALHPHFMEVSDDA